MWLFALLVTPPCPTALVGDSTAVRLDPVPYAHFEAVGGRSLVEHREGKETGPMVAQRLIDDGFVGCWVIVLGTNDAANLSGKNAAPRIRKMLDTIGSSPVLWIDAATLRTEGPYKTDHMKVWNKTLDSGAATYPNVTVAKWSDVVERHWFSDGIHYTKHGMQKRSEFVQQRAQAQDSR